MALVRRRAIALIVVAVAVGACGDESVVRSLEPVDPSASGLTRGQAVGIARAAVPQSARLGVLSATAGSAGDLLRDGLGGELLDTIPHERWVWVVNLGGGPPLGGAGSFVVIDFVNGDVYGVFGWIS